MNRSTILASVLFMSVGSGSLLAEPAAGAAPDFKGMMKKTATAWETLDPAKAAPFYAKDAALVFFDIAPLKCTGWDEAAAGAAKVAGFSSAKFNFNDDLRSQRRGNVAWGTGTGHADIVNKDGSKLPLDFRWTLIWEKRGNHWLIVHDNISVPLPEPAPSTGTR